jgi:hypothetical protein
MTRAREEVCGEKVDEIIRDRREKMGSWTELGGGLKRTVYRLVANSGLVML